MQTFSCCSQNGIFVQTLLKRYDIEFSSLKMGIQERSHFASAAKIDEDWYYLDGYVNYESNNKLYKVNDVLDTSNEDIIYKIFAYDPEFIQAVLKGRKTRETYMFSINKMPYKKGLFFQKITSLISNWSWLFFLSIYYLKSFTKKGFIRR